jgi:hypothetical protein
MKSLSIKAAVSAALLASAGSAFAGTVDTNGNNLRIAGATATNKVLFDTFLSSASGICAAGNVHVYTTQTSLGTSFGSNSVVVTCTAKTGFTGQFAVLNGAAVGYSKQGSGGSGEGTGTLAAGTNQTFTSTTGCGTTSSVSTAGLLTYTLHPSCPTTSLEGEVGIADVEGDLLGYTGGGITANPMLDIVFGVPVTKPLYTALQAAQGLTQDDSCANVPTLTAGQISAIYSGQISNASSLLSSTAEDGSALPNKAIHICRRGNGSGTQASAKAYFLGEGCMTRSGAAFAVGDFGEETFNGNKGKKWTDPLPQAAIDSGYTSFLDYAVFAGDGSGDVVSCLNGFGAKAGDDFAIGVLSTENAPNLADATQRYRYVRVDGALPTLEQTANGNYTYFTSNVINVRDTYGYTGIENALVAYLKNLSPTVISGINAALPGKICTTSGTGDGTAVGDPGVLVSATYNDVFSPPAGHVAPYTGAEIAAYPVNSQTRQVNGLNNCQAPLNHSLPGMESAGGEFRPNLPQ